ncbi:MAG TPA: hypothetical protein VMG41_06430 [Gemmatimonadales bacterium]|nr:hypothetical protein [Gemmatimonadales bacterium]
MRRPEQQAERIEQRKRLIAELARRKQEFERAWDPAARRHGQEADALNGLEAQRVAQIRRVAEAEGAATAIRLDYASHRERLELELRKTADQRLATVINRIDARRREGPFADAFEAHEVRAIHQRLVDLQLDAGEDLDAELARLAERMPERWVRVFTGVDDDAARN